MQNINMIKQFFINNHQFTLRLHVKPAMKFGGLRNKFYLCRRILKLKLKKMAYKISDSCVACGTCIDECPVGAISEGDIYVIDADTCTSCGTCAGVCPTEAISEE